MMNEPRQTLLAVHAHPDDESSSTGGTLARYSAAGTRTLLVTCTGGEVGEISNPSLARPETLAAVRAQELAEAIRILGISRAIALGYRDSGMAGTPDNTHPDSFHQADFEEATRRVVAIIRQERPQVVVTYDENGGYGHPDHVRAHQVTVAAFQAAGDPRSFPDLGSPWTPSKLYYVVWPRSMVEGFRQAFREAGIESPFGTREEDAEATENAEPGGVPDELVTTAVDVSAYWDVKWTALLAHKTQIDPQGIFFRLPLERLRELWSYEYFRRVVGPGTVRRNMSETDLFADL